MIYGAPLIEMLARQLSLSPSPLLIILKALTCYLVCYLLMSTWQPIRIHDSWWSLILCVGCTGRGNIVCQTCSADQEPAVHKVNQMLWTCIFICVFSWEGIKLPNCMLIYVVGILINLAFIVVIAFKLHNFIIQHAWGIMRSTWCSSISPNFWNASSFRIFENFLVLFNTRLRCLGVTCFKEESVSLIVTSKYQEGQE